MLVRTYSLGGAVYYISKNNVVFVKALDLFVRNYCCYNSFVCFAQLAHTKRNPLCSMKLMYLVVFNAPGFNLAANTHTFSFSIITRMLFPPCTIGDGLSCRSQRFHYTRKITLKSLSPSREKDSVYTAT